MHVDLFPTQVRHLVSKVRGPFTDFEGTIQADERKDRGLTWNAALETGGFLVGDEITISLSFEAIAG